MSTAQMWWFLFGQKRRWCLPFAFHGVIPGIEGQVMVGLGLIKAVTADKGWRSVYLSPPIDNP